MDNLPPGCNISDLPGNRPEDLAWESLLEEIGNTPISAAEARKRWESQPRLLEAVNKAIDLLQELDQTRKVKNRLKTLIAAANSSYVLILED